MKNHIHTIPVLEAFNKAKEQGGCPFCRMFDKLNADAIDFIMGPAYMEDDVRMETNRTGFCGNQPHRFLLLGYTILRTNSVISFGGIPASVRYFIFFSRELFSIVRCIAVCVFAEKPK